MVFYMFQPSFPSHPTASQLQLQPSQSRRTRAQPPQQPAKPNKARDMFSAPAAQTKVWANIFLIDMFSNSCVLIRISHHPTYPCIQGCFQGYSNYSILKVLSNYRLKSVLSYIKLHHSTLNTALLSWNLRRTVALSVFFGFGTSKDS